MPSFRFVRDVTTTHISPNTIHNSTIGATPCSQSPPLRLVAPAQGIITSLNQAANPIIAARTRKIPLRLSLADLVQGVQDPHEQEHSSQNLALSHLLRLSSCDTHLVRSPLTACSTPRVLDSTTNNTGIISHAPCVQLCHRCHRSDVFREFSYI